MIERKNFSGDPAPDVGSETEFKDCNFSQPQPVLNGSDYEGVRLWPGDDTPRTFNHCNLVNCEPPPGSTLIDCNTTIRRNLVATGTDAITVDGVDLTVTTYSDFIYGRGNGDGTYTYHPTPLEFPHEEVVE